MSKRVWVLDTETKGTGAQMVPLDTVVKTPEPTDKPLLVPRKRQPKPAPEAAPRPPRRFKVVDLSTRQVLADDIDTRTALDVLGGIRSSVDVNVSVWEPSTETWRLLTLREKRLLWERRAAQG